jgi:hypothetical protein
MPETTWAATRDGSSTMVPTVYFARRGRNHREGNTLVDPAGVASCRAVRVWLSGEAPACKAVYTGSNPVIRSIFM